MRLVRPYILLFMSAILFFYGSYAYGNSFSVTPGILEFDSAGSGISYSHILHVYGAKNQDGAPTFGVSLKGEPAADWISTNVYKNNDGGHDVDVHLKVPKKIVPGVYHAAIELTSNIYAMGATVAQINRVPITIDVSSRQTPHFKLDSITYAGAFRDAKTGSVMLSFNADVRNLSAVSASIQSAKLRLIDQITGDEVGIFSFEEFNSIPAQAAWSGALEFSVPHAFGLYKADLTLYDTNGVVEGGSAELFIDVPFQLETKKYAGVNITVVLIIILSGLFVGLSFYLPYHKRTYEKK